MLVFVIYFILSFGWTSTFSVYYYALWFHDLEGNTNKQTTTNKQTKTVVHILPTLEKSFYCPWCVKYHDNKLPFFSRPVTSWNDRWNKQTNKYPNKHTNKQLTNKYTQNFNMYKTATLPHDLPLGRGRPHQVPSVSPMDGWIGCQSIQSYRMSSTNNDKRKLYYSHTAL